MDDQRETRKTVAAFWWEFEHKSLEYSKEYGAITLRGLFLINGGAIISILTLIGSLLQNPNGLKLSELLFESIWFFALGLIATILATGIGYVNFQALNYMQPGPDGLRKYIDTGDASGWKISKIPIVTAWSAVVLSGASAFLFFYGLYLALSGFEAMLGLI
jgi:hypothetical protein